MPPTAAPLSVADILDRMDRQAERASEERRAMAEQWGERMREVAEDAEQHAERTAASLGQRITDLGASMDRRVGDLIAEMHAGREDARAARKESRVVNVLMLLIIAGMGGLTLWIKPDGSAGVAPAGVADGAEEDMSYSADLLPVAEPGDAMGAETLPAP